MMFFIGTIDQDIIDNGTLPGRDLQSELKKYIRARYVQVDSLQNVNDVSYGSCQELMDVDSIS